MNKSPTFKLFLSLFIIATASLLDGDDEVESELLEFTSSYEIYWDVFNVSPESMISPGRRYLLKNVLKNGSVELIADPCSDYPKVVIARPLKDEPKKSNKPLVLYVVESNYQLQTATIRELRMR